jgi:hypothetical protein
MVEIRHKDTGAILHRLDVDTLEMARLAGLNLCDADLAGANLAGADLTGAVCRAARMQGANLARANLTSAYLADADFRNANLSGAVMVPVSLDSADLTGANLTGADLTGAYLAEAKLTQATLTYANLQSTHLGGADLTGARVAFTLFADCPSLHLAIGHSEIQHLGPSTVDLRTLRSGVTALPDDFLLGVGLSREEIDTLRTLYAGPIPFSSCVLAHAVSDAEFSTRLCADLRRHNVSSWDFCPDLEAGYPHQTAFNMAMNGYDRLVLICSRQSLLRPEVAERAAVAMERERETGAQKLFPIHIDDFVDSSDFPRIAEQRMATGEWHEDWVRCVREHPVADFRSWTDETSYFTQLQALIDALRRHGARRSSL